MTSRYSGLVGALLGLALSFAASSAEVATAPASTADEANVRALYEQLLEGWNRGSGAEFASVFDEHADLVGPGGFHLKGRERIAAFHQTLFDGTLRGTQLVGAVRSVRFLTHDVAVVHAIGRPFTPGAPAGTARRQSIHTLVAVRRDGKWLLDAFQATPI